MVPKCPRLLRPPKECIRVKAQMNSIFSCDRGTWLAAPLTMARLAIFLGFVIISATPFAAWLHAQSGSDPTAEFKRISGGLSAAKLGGRDENEVQMEKTLAYQGSTQVSILNVPANPDLHVANRRL